MPLTTLARVRLVPTLRNTVKVGDAWLQQLIDAADRAIKQYTKRWLELRAYVDFYTGNEMRDIICRQWPVLTGTTQVSAASNGAALPAATINVASTAGFDPGGRGTSEQLPTIAVQTSASTYTTVQYQAVTATSFTGCTGGTGTLSSQQGKAAVYQPAVWFDPNGYGGQSQPGTSPFSSTTGPFGDGTLMVQGANYITLTDGMDVNNDWQQTSKRGLIRRIGGYGQQGFIGYFPNDCWGGGQGKLASRRLPTWPSGGECNIKVAYSAGYGIIPDDLSNVAEQLVATLVRINPQGDALQSEGLGAYSYSILKGSQEPEMMTARQTLGRYREVSW